MLFFFLLSVILLLRRRRILGEPITHSIGKSFWWEELFFLSGFLENMFRVPILHTSCKWMRKLVLNNTIFIKTYFVYLLVICSTKCQRMRRCAFSFRNVVARRLPPFEWKNYCNWNCKGIIHEHANGVFNITTPFGPTSTRIIFLA